MRAAGRRRVTAGSSNRRMQGARERRQTPVRAYANHQVRRQPGRTTKARRVDYPLVRRSRPLLVPAASGSQIESAPAATNQKPRPSAAEFRFGSIVSWKAASTRADACALSARCRARVISSDMLVGEEKQDCGDFLDQGLPVRDTSIETLTR